MAVRMTGMISGMDTESLIQSMVDAQRMKNKKVSDKSQLLEWKQEKWKDLNTKLYKLYTEDLSKLRMQGNYNSKKATSSNEDLVGIKAQNGAVSGSHTISVEKLASAQILTGGQITKDKDGNVINVTSSTKLVDLGIELDTLLNVSHKNEDFSLKVSSDTTISDFVNTLKSAGLNANFDTSQKRFFISSKESGEANTFELTASKTVDGTITNVNSQLNFLKLDAIEVGTDGKIILPSSTVSTLKEASDSEYTYNGAKLKNSTNEVTVNGLSLTLKGVTNGDVNVSVSNNTQANYDMIKKFVTNYNAILKEMNELYYADSAKGYDPLSDDEKEAMTESQIEKWEDKIKGSIFRRDNTIGSLLSTMKNAVMSTVEVDGKTYSLASFGIGTSSDYTEKGLLHIDGDADDATVSSVADKLMKALEANPDTVAAVISGVSKKLYDDMGQKMKAIPNVRSALTFYNDKTMIDQQREYKKKIQTLESKLIDLENKYYKQFAAMESALAKLQSQTSALSGLLGTNSQ